LATLKVTTNGFNAGDLYFGLGNGGIGTFPADGSTSNPLLTLPDPNEVRGSLYVDQTGTWSNNLIVVTGNSGDGPTQKGYRNVWQIDANKNTNLVASIYTHHLEGVITLTNDVAKWGPWAGKSITGDEDGHLIYAIDTNGVVTSFDLGIDPEDFDIIQTYQDLYCADPYFVDPNTGLGGGVLKVSRSLLTNYVGDLLITQAGETAFPPNAKLFIVHWDGTEFVTRSISYARPDGFGGNFEHVSFAPINIPSHAIMP
jgi:hypothetical protein